MNKTPPLIVDLDGTLIRNDLTHELLLLCARWQLALLPLAIFKLLVSRADGKRWLARRFAHHVEPDHLPYEQAVLDLIAEHKSTGHAVELVSGSDQKLVERIARHVGLFDSFAGSTPPVNLTSHDKSSYLQHRHPSGYLYVGNSHQDIPVWATSVGGFGVRAPSIVYRPRQTSATGLEIEKLVEKSSQLKPIIRAFRLHQWAKNLLIFLVPGLLLSSLAPLDFLNLLIAFFCFSLLASGTYLINDLFDIPDDRAHHKKRSRPLAAGALSAPVAIIAILATTGAAGALSILIGWQFGAVLAAYALATISYSFRLKQIPIIDVITLSGLFCIRVVAGAVVIDAPLSPWLMTFIGLVF